MSAAITLTTDFGSTDAYVAAMKGVMLGVNPDSNIIDICHSIKPQDISHAAFVLSTVYQFFPAKTIHVVVVDPGVGTERRAVILRTPAADFVAPDNGVLSYVIQRESKSFVPNTTRRKIKLGPELQAVAITKSQFWRSPVSPTFHGRDIFAPVAARLSLGMSPLDFGESINSLTILPLPRPHKEGDSLTGEIIHVDSFGNLITDIREGDLPPDRQILVEVGGQRIAGLARTYADRNGLTALFGSSGYLEVAFNGGNAREFLNARVGDSVLLKYPKSQP